MTSRVETLLELAPLLPEKLRAEVIEAALNAARETDSETDRAVNLIKVAKLLNEPEKSDELKLALEIILSFNDSSSKAYSQSEAIRDFIEVASDELLPPALAIYNTFSDKQYRAKVELALAARLFIRGETDAALRIFKSFDSPLFDTQIVWALMKIAPFVTLALMPEVLSIALKISSGYYAPDILVKLAPHLSESLVRQAAKTVRAMHTADDRTRSHAALAKRMIDFSNYKLFEEIINTVLQDTLTPTVREEVLEILAPHINGETLQQIFSVVQKISDLNQQILTVLTLSAYLLAQERLNVLQEEISRSQLIKDENQRGEATAQIIIRLAEINEFDKAFELAFELRPFNWRAKALAGILANSPDNFRKRIYDRIVEHWMRKGEQAATGELLKNLAPHLTTDFAFEALGIINRLDELYRAKAYADIAPFVPINLLREVIIPVLNTIHSNLNINEFSRNSDEKRLSVAVAKRLAELGAGEEAFNLAGTIADETARSDAFEKIIPHLSIKNLVRLREEAAKFPYEGRRHGIDRFLAPRFAALGNDVTVATLLDGIKNATQRAVACADTARYSGEELRRHSIHRALEIVDFMQEQTGGSGDFWQGEVFAKLAPYLPIDDLMRGWQLSLKIEDDNKRRKALSALSTKLLEYPHNELYPFWNTAMHALALRSRKNLLIDLQSLAGIINSLGGASAIAESIRAIHHTGRWW